MATFEEVLAAENAADAKAEAAGLYEPGKQYHNPKNKVAQANDAELPKDNQDTPDEENVNEEDGSKAEENVDSKLSILVNGETIQISEDLTGTHIQNKLEGHGIHVQQNGDIIILSGSGGKGKACGGRMLINTKNGQITKSGPIVEEITASSKSAIEGDGSTTTEGAGNSQVAYSGSFSGDHEVEVQGTKYIKARDIVLDATDTLTLRGTKVIVAVDEWIEDKGLQKSKVDNIEEEVTSQRISEVKEDTSKQYDGRASKNTVGSGHINENVKGDYQMRVAGIYNLQIQGNDVGVPLVKTRNFGLNIGVNNNSITGGARLNANDMIDISTNSKNIILNSGKGIGIDAYAVDDPPENGEVRISGSTPGVKMISWSGASESNSTIVQATQDGVEITAKKKVEIEAKTDDVTIKSTAKDVKVEAPLGNFDVDALKIFLN